MRFCSAIREQLLTTSKANDDSLFSGECMWRGLMRFLSVPPHASDSPCQVSMRPLDEGTTFDSFLAVQPPADSTFKCRRRL